MSKKIDLREATKTDWHITVSDDASNYPGNENIKIGCLLRIADAVELMAKNYLEMQRRVKFLEGNRDYYRERLHEQYKRSAALKGVITKLKKKIQ